MYLSRCIFCLSELRQHIVFCLSIVPFIPICEVEGLVDGEELPLASMTPLSVSIEQLVVWDVPFCCSQFHDLVFLQVAKLRDNALVRLQVHGLLQQALVKWGCVHYLLRKNPVHLRLECLYHRVVLGYDISKQQVHSPYPCQHIVVVALVLRSKSD